MVAPLSLIGHQPAPATAPAVNYPPHFIPKTLTLSDGSTWRYVLYVPPQYEENKDHHWPVILFLHGSGEMGTDNIRQTGVGLPRYIRKNPESFPFVVIMPQVSEMWYRGRNGAAMLAILDQTLSEYRTDPDRVYLTGLSMGGFGTWELAVTQPDRFAAIAPVCGMAPTDYLSNIKEMPVWAFHGEKDPNVPVSGSRDAIGALRKLGSEPKYSEYPNEGHKIWDMVYGSKQLYRWFLEHKRPAAPRKIDYRIPGPLARLWWLTALVEKNSVGKARIRAEIDDQNTLTLTTEGVKAWSVTCEDDPLKRGDPIQVIMNGELVYRGPFSGSMGYGWPQRTDHAGTPTSAPVSSAPSD